MSLEGYANRLEVVLRVPQPNSAVRSGGRDPLAVVGVSHAENGVLIGAKHGDRLTGLGIPDTGRTVITARHDAVAVGAVTDAVQLIALVAHHRLPVGRETADIPNLKRIVVPPRSRHDLPAVRTERGTPYRVRFRAWHVTRCRSGHRPD